MRPAVLLFALFLLVPILACESGLTEPMPDESVADLQQPFSVEPLFANGTPDQTQDQIQEALKKQDGSCQDATATADTDAEKQQAAGTRTRKGMQESAEGAKVKMRKQHQGRN